MSWTIDAQSMQVILLPEVNRISTRFGTEGGMDRNTIATDAIARAYVHDPHDKFESCKVSGVKVGSQRGFYFIPRLVEILNPG